MVAKQVISGAVATVLMGCALPVAAQSPQAPAKGAPIENAQDEAPAANYYTLDIPRLSIIEALKEFTTQTGLQISFWPDAQTDQTMLIGPLHGKFTAEVALTRLLASSGLAFKRTNDRSLVVMAPSLLGTPRNGVTVSDPERSRLAEGEPHLRALNQPAPRASIEMGAAGSASTNRPLARESLDEVIVTGSRMERSGEGPAPVQVFTRRTIEELGAASIPEVLRYMPQQPFTRPEFYYQNPAQYSQMRGIGVDTTLILINGRRVAATANSLTLNSFDLSTIPLAAVEKIEVLSDSASAIYGADAMGGVINVVLKKEIPQPVIDVQYGGASGGAGLLRSSLSAGHSTARSRISAMFDYYDRDPLLGAERRWADQDYRRYGGIDYRTLAGMPATVRSETGDNLPGLSSSFATVPYGSSGIGLTPADFAATAGMQNYSSTLSAAALVPETHQRSLALFAEYDLTPELVAFAEVLHTDRETTKQDELYTVRGASVPATNPFNPFGQTVLVDFALDGIGPTWSLDDLQSMRGAAGLRGWLNSTWQWEVATVASTETVDTVGVNSISEARLNAALAATDPAHALNPFVDGPVASPELLASLVEPYVQHHYSRGRQLSAFMRGDLFELPAGSLQAVVGGEWRDEEMIYDDKRQSVDDGRDVRALFTELRVPLLGPAADTRHDVLSMTVAARVDDYSDFGSTVNPQFGVMWRPTRDILLRGSYGTSFRPPSLYELHSPPVAVTNVPVRDPARDAAISSVSVVGGGNPNLQPIEAESMTAGFVLMPRALPSLRVLASYWNISSHNRVTYLHYSSLLANEDAFPDRVLREEQTPADIAAGIPGRLLQLDVSRMNFGRLTTNGIDFEVNYELETRWGDFTPRLSATWVHEFESVDEPFAEPVNHVGVASLSGSIPRWRVVGGLSWKRNGVGVSTTLDWLPGYMDADANGLTGRRLPSRTLVDAQASFELDELLGPESIWDDLKVQVGVRNMFDEIPPFSAIGFAYGYDSSQGDLTGRFGYLRLTKGF